MRKRKKLMFNPEVQSLFDILYSFENDFGGLSLVGSTQVRQVFKV